MVSGVNCGGEYGLIGTIVQPISFDYATNLNENRAFNSEQYGVVSFYFQCVVYLSKELRANDIIPANTHTIMIE
jgi:hypothetical protein